MASTSGVVSPVALHRLWLPSRVLVSMNSIRPLIGAAGVVGIDGRSCERSLQPVGGHAGAAEVRMAEDADQQRAVGLHAIDVDVLQSVDQLIDGLLTIVGVGDHLGQQA